VSVENSLITASCCEVIISIGVVIRVNKFALLKLFQKFHLNIKPLLFPNTIT